MDATNMFSRKSTLSLAIFKLRRLELTNQIKLSDSNLDFVIVIGIMANSNPDFNLVIPLTVNFDYNDKHWKFHLKYPRFKP